MQIREIQWLVANEAMNIWRFRWTALITAWLIGIAGWLNVLAMPDEYRASARVYVDFETVLRPLLRGLAVEPDTENQISMISKALTSRPKLEALVADTGLADSAFTPEEYERLLIDVRRRIGINQVRRQPIYTISFSDTNPEKASQVVQALLEVFIEGTLAGDRDEAEQAQQFLQDQIATYEARLLDAEQQLATFKRDNVGLMPGQGGGYYQRLQTAQSSVQAIKARIDTVKQQREALIRQIQEEDPNLSEGPGAGSTSVDATIASMESELDSLLRRYTEKHPQVVSTRETLEDLYKLRSQQSSGPTSTRSGSGAANPIYQELRLSLSEIEVELASQEAQLVEEERMLGFLRSQVDTIPEIEAELNRLNRDYDVVKAQYEAMLTRLESAKPAEEIQEDTKSIMFDVIDPPRAPVFPTGPNRALFSTIVLLFAIAAGIGMAFLLGQLKPMFFTLPSLQKETSLPIYGVVERARGLGRSPRYLAFTLCTMALLLVFGAFLTSGPLIRSKASQLLVAGGISL